MKINILGICGTFMGGIAVLAREAGHEVAGADRNVYPPMSTQLERLGIALHQGYDRQAVGQAADMVIVGNVMSRGNEAIEALLDSGQRYTSGPQWLYDNVLSCRHVLAVAGTHGKTTTASMLAWILEAAGLRPGFLIGGVPIDFGVSARLGDSPYFVVEADEYDTAFFDKRSKFVHYRPRTLVMTNLEYDHADIFEDLESIRRQFHHLVRTVPSSGRIIAHSDSEQLDQVLGAGCWTPLERYGHDAGHWRVSGAAQLIEVSHENEQVSAEFRWPGLHYRLNAVAACAAAATVGVPLAESLQALSRWSGVRRRLDKIGVKNDITVYDDFAHHPTEIAATLDGLRGVIGRQRLIAVFEPRSNSMKSGAHRNTLADAFDSADIAVVLDPDVVRWDLRERLSGTGKDIRVITGIEPLLEQLLRLVQPGDHVVVMSNGAFGGLPQRLYSAL